MANGPPSENSPLAQTSGYATDCGGVALFDSPRGGTSPCRGPCAGGLAGAHPGLKNQILLNYTRIENAHKVRKKTFDFVVIYRSPANF